MFYITEDGLYGDSFYEIRRLEMLIDDLKRILDRQAPTDEELERSPYLEGYKIALRARPCLVGHVKGHPLLGERNVVTSELWVFAPEMGWARTHSRFYRLGMSSKEANRS